MKKFESFRLRIAQYFDDMINQIDINTEYQLLNCFFDLNQQNNINSTRDVLINKINMIKKHNLENIKKLELHSNQCDLIFDEDYPISKLFDKFCFIIDLKTLNYFNDEFNDLGFLVVTDFYLSPAKIENIIEIIHDEWQFMNGMKSAPIARAKHTLSKELIYSHEIVNKIIDKNFDTYQIITITKEMNKSIRLNELVLTNIEESLLDEIPILELNITYLQDLLSLNNAAKSDNFTLETLIVHYTYNEWQQESKLSQLNLDKFKGLRKLHLINEVCYNKSCNIERIHLKEDMLNNLNNLEDLKIQEYFLESVYKNQFNCLRNLKKLSVNYSDLSINNDQSGFKCITLESMGIIQLYDKLGNILRDMDFLTGLELISCCLKNDDLDFLKYLPNLEILNLGRNNINFLIIQKNSSLKPFKSLIKLKHLDLSSNQIFHLYQTTFEGLDNLEVLSLEEVPITEIEDYFFVRFKKLKILNLSEIYCPNLQLNENTFKGLDSVEILNIPSDLISNPSVFKNFPKLKHLLNFVSSKESNISNQYYNEIYKQIIPQSLDLRIPKILINEESNPLNEFKNLDELYLHFELNNTENVNNLIIDYFAGFSQLKKLIISISPSVETLSSSIFNYNLECLDTLYLDRIGLTHLQDDIFDRLANLKYLSLKYNDLKSIDGVKLFKNLNKLEYLDLELNEVEIIHPHSFDNLIKLKYLNILNNSLSKLDSNIFDKLVNLQTLFLETLNISLTKDYFKNLKKLYQLKITTYFTDNFNEDIFYHLTSLNCLTIFWSDINSITENLFSRLQNLIYLNMEENKIRFIHPNAFSHLVNLITLSISKNSIEEFDLDLLNNHKKLRILDSFPKTSLKKFDFDLLDKFPDLRVLSVIIKPETEKFKRLLSRDKNDDWKPK